MTRKMRRFQQEEIRWFGVWAHSRSLREPLPTKGLDGVACFKEIRSVPEKIHFASVGKSILVECWGLLRRIRESREAHCRSLHFGRDDKVRGCVSIGICGVEG